MQFSHGILISFKIHFSQKVGLDDLPRPLPTWAVLRFCQSERTEGISPHNLIFGVVTLNVHWNTNETHSKPEAKTQCKTHTEAKFTLLPAVLRCGFCVI